tara:strand:- start:1068 stop:1580 length:513 start_codon:yes stop_codon:yes gene_type:complete
MFKKVFLIIITVTLFYTSPLYAKDKGGAIETIKQMQEEDRNKATNYSKGIKHLSKALKYDDKKKFDKAEEYYLKAINYFLEHNKDFFLEPNVLFLIGLSYEKINNFENANLYYQIGLELEPKHININKQLAEYYITENQINFAKQRVEAIKGCNCLEYNDLKEKILKIKK